METQMSVGSSLVEHPLQGEGGGSTPTPTLHKSDWRVYDADMRKSRLLVERLHYAGGTSNTATALHGLYRRLDLQLLGVAWWIPPTRTCAAAWWHEPEEVLSLSRLVIAPSVPRNGASFLLSHSVKLLDPRWVCLVTYADTWRGHTGRIYTACGWEHMGLTRAERTYTVDMRMVSRKAGPKTRTHAEMLAIGAECVGSFQRHRFRLIRKVQVPTQPKTLAFDWAAHDGPRRQAEDLLMEEALTQGEQQG